MPTSTHSEQEVDDVYDMIEELMDNEKAKDYIIIVGDWNAVVGRGKESDTIGPYGLGRRNERGQKLIDFCKR